MTWIQRLLSSLVPQSWRQSMEAESRRWHVQCPCGYEQSVWNRGGIRWKATGEPKVFGKCPGCGQNTWQRVYYKNEMLERSQVESK